jgi:hypothetical protein
MNRAALAALFGVGFLLVPATTAHAQNFKSVSDCTPGRRVANKEGQTGTIVRVDGYMNLCQVRLDNGQTSYSIFWMLHPAGGANVTQDNLRAGKYECFTLNNGHMNYTFTDFYITGPNTYRSGNGTFRYRQLPGKRIVFDNGPLAGHPAYVSDGPSIVIGATTCDLKR